jgi:hypothetical protein
VVKLTAIEAVMPGLSTVLPDICFMIIVAHEITIDIDSHGFDGVDTVVEVVGTLHSTIDLPLHA